MSPSMTKINLALVALTILVAFWVLVKSSEVVSNGWEKIGLAEAGLMLATVVLVLSNL